MTKVVTIDFKVYAAKGEVPFRTYVSNRPVDGYIFAFLSKILADNQVFYKLYSMKSGEATLQLERTSSIEQFTEDVKRLESNLQKVDPNTELIAKFGDSAIAFSDKGKIYQNDKGLSALVEQELGEMLDSSGVSREEFILNAVRNKSLDRHHIMMLMLTVRPDKRYQFLKDLNATDPLFMPTDLSHALVTLSEEDFMKKVISMNKMK